jgi:hypothetical protein
LIAQELSDHIQLLLSSGQTLKVGAIELYPAEQLAKIAGIRAQAAQKLGGVSTGLGFIGSPEWVIGASALLGVLEAALSDSSKKQALSLCLNKQNSWQLRFILKAGYVKSKSSGISSGRIRARGQQMPW